MLIISWVFELTPDGLRREDDAAPAAPIDSVYPKSGTNSARQTCAERLRMVIIAASNT